jgi:ABC-type bacteriocin/lantibiotic exporter with double-glycine peptidase domain
LRLQKAVKKSFMSKDVASFDMGLEKEVGENGFKLSKGQKVRINLARCLYSDPEMFIFDDLLANLDKPTAANIWNSTIVKDLKDKTRIVVTHSTQLLK